MMSSVFLSVRKYRTEAATPYRLVHRNIEDLDHRIVRISSTEVKTVGAAWHT